jgi:hypothetical protein
MRREAVRYAVHNWSILPVHTPRGDGCSCGKLECASVGKHPRLSRGLASATTDRDKIQKWWRKWPDANIGIHAGRSGLVVIDVDPRHGGCVDDLPLTDADRITPTANTGGGGFHLLYRVPPGIVVSNSSQLLPDGIDVRAGRAYIVAPPSLHVSGQRYSWQSGRSPWEVDPRPLPDALLPLLKVRQEPVDRDSAPAPRLPESFSNERGYHPYVAAALHGELDRLSQAKIGSRNDTLNSVAFNLGQFVEAGLLHRAEVEWLLHNAARAISLGELETRRTIRSGIEAGIRNPRSTWPDWR